MRGFKEEIGVVLVPLLFILLFVLGMFFVSRCEVEKRALEVPYGYETTVYYDSGEIKTSIYSHEPELGSQGCVTVDFKVVACSVSYFTSKKIKIK